MWTLFLIDKVCLQSLIPPCQTFLARTHLLLFAKIFPSSSICLTSNGISKYRILFQELTICGTHYCRTASLQVTTWSSSNQLLAITCRKLPHKKSNLIHTIDYFSYSSWQYFHLIIFIFEWLLILISLDLTVNKKNKKSCRISFDLWWIHMIGLIGAATHYGIGYAVIYCSHWFIIRKYFLSSYG